MSNQQHIDDLMSSRAEIRRLRKLVIETRAAFTDAKSELAAANARGEQILDEIEQKQGRLPFDEATKPKAKRPRKRAEGVAARSV